MKDFIVQDNCQIPVIGEVYKKYFSSIDKGFFVEVGAYDGRNWTNTGFLADIGWEGIYIEPIQRYMNLCKENHKNNNVVFEQVAIGSSDTVAEIYLAEGLSTIDTQILEAHKVMYPYYSHSEKETVPIKTLTSILEKYNVSCNFDLLVVDAEGYEKEIFESFSLQVYRPKMMIVELCDIHGGYSSYPEIQAKAKKVREHILDSRYDQIYVDPINTIFWNIDNHLG